jgi:hypothetical protein
VRPARLPHALKLSGQLRLFHIYPVNMVNRKKEYPDKMVGNHFEHLQDGPKGKVQDVLCKMPIAAKVFYRKKWLILGANRVVVTNVLFLTDSNTLT